MAYFNYQNFFDEVLEIIHTKITNLFIAAILMVLLSACSPIVLAADNQENVTIQEPAGQDAVTQTSETAAAAAEQEMTSDEDTDDTYPTPHRMVSNADGVFVYGGAHGDLPLVTGAYVARLDVQTNKEVWRTELINVVETGDWNYPGDMVLHSNGDLYAIFGYQLARLDVESGEVIQKIQLPFQGASSDTAYNKIELLVDGTLVTKSNGRISNCDEQGFNAFLNCDDTLNVPPSVLVAIDPETLIVISQTNLPGFSFGEIMATVHNGVTYIYLTDQAKLIRYTFDGETFALDESWGFVTYLYEGQTAAYMLTVLNDWVVVQTNSVPSRTPYSVVMVSQDDSGLIHRIEPFANSSGMLSFHPHTLTVDEVNNRIYTQDIGAGKLAALDFDPTMGMSIAWVVEQASLNAATLTGEADNRILVTSDRPGFNIFQLVGADNARDFGGGNGASNDLVEQVVWRDAASGEELLRSEMLPVITPRSMITVGDNGLVYYLSLNGSIYMLDGYEQ